MDADSDARRRPRPAMQIYRPPGVRAPGQKAPPETNSSSTSPTYKESPGKANESSTDTPHKPHQVAGTKQPVNNNNNNNSNKHNNHNHQTKQQQHSPPQQQNGRQKQQQQQQQQKNDINNGNKQQRNGNNNKEDLSKSLSPPNNVSPTSNRQQKASAGSAATQKSAPGTPSAGRRQFNNQRSNTMAVIQRTVHNNNNNHHHNNNSYNDGHNNNHSNNNSNNTAMTKSASDHQFSNGGGAGKRSPKPSKVNDSSKSGHVVNNNNNNSNNGDISAIQPMLREINNNNQSAPDKNETQKLYHGNPGTPGTDSLTNGHNVEAPVVVMRDNAAKNRNAAVRKSLILAQQSLMSASSSQQTKAARVLNDKELAEVRQTLADVQMTQFDAVNKYLQSGCKSSEDAAGCARAIAQSAADGQQQNTDAKSLARATALMIETTSAFHDSLVGALTKVYERRDELRQKQFRDWLAFINFVSDVYSTLGFSYEGDLVEVVFKVYEYLLHEPVLDTLRIEELECLISSLLAVGYDLERQSPDQVAQLRDSIRDALVQAHEPWARKMILLLVELSASGWKLPTQANDYYFQTQSAHADPH